MQRPLLLMCTALVSCGSAEDIESVAAAPVASGTMVNTLAQQKAASAEPVLAVARAPVNDLSAALLLVNVEPQVDAGLSDAGALDAGGLDASVVDAGALDAGAHDASVVDAGALDAGLRDASVVDAGPVTPWSNALADAAVAPLSDAGPQWQSTRVYDAGIDAGVLTFAPATTVILYNPADAWVLAIAQDLQRLLQHATGSSGGFGLVTQTATLPVSATVVIALGNTSYADPARQQALFRDGFYVQRDRRAVGGLDASARVVDLVVIAGGLRSAALNTVGGASAYAQGTWSGAMGFLDRYAGVRSYLASGSSSDMTWVSRRASLTVAMADVGFESEPWVESLKVTGFRAPTGAVPMAGETNWAARNAFGTRRLGAEHQHNVQQIFPPGCRDKSTTDCPQLFTASPELYPVYPLNYRAGQVPDGSVMLDGGYRYRPAFNSVPVDAANGWDQYWQPCFSAATAVPAAVSSIATLQMAMPRDYVAVSINDFGAVCPADVAQGFRASDVYWHFINQTSQQVSARVMGLSYGAYGQLPPFRLNDNVVVFSNYGPAEWPTDGANITRELQQWALRTRHWGNHTWAHGQGYLIPRVFTASFQQLLQTAIRAGLDAKYAHVEAYPNWGLTGPQLYLMARLTWDPFVNTGALRQQFADDMFGPAASDMNAYFVTLEALWNQLDTGDVYVNAQGQPLISERKQRAWVDSGSYVSQFATTAASRALYAQARANLNAAMSHSLTSTERARVQFFSDTFALTEALMRAYDLKKSGAPTADRQAAIDAASTLWNSLRLTPGALYETGNSTQGGTAYTGTCPAGPADSVASALCALRP